MEEENNEEIKVEVQNGEVETKKSFDFIKKITPKQWFIYGGIAIAVLLVIIILAVALGGGPKKAVKSFISGMNERNAKKIVNSIDIAGMQAWSLGYYKEGKSFKTKDYKEFIEEYKDVDKDDIKEYKEELIDEIKDNFEDIKDEYKTYKFKIEKFKKVNKLGDKLYSIDAKISINAKPKDKDEDELDESSTVTFVVYKSKLVYLGGLDL